MSCDSDMSAPAHPIGRGVIVLTHLQFGLEREETQPVYIQRADADRRREMRPSPPSSASESF